MRKKVIILSLIAVVVSASTLGLVIYRIFFIKPVRVPSGSMMNTILPGDQLFIQKLLSNPERGDIVMYRFPSEKEQFLGRVIGLPGEKIQIVKTSILIDGKPINEEHVTVGAEGPYDQHLTELSREGRGPYAVYYNAPDEMGEPDDYLDPTVGVREPYTIPKDSYFILGDNRDNSSDSRYRGAVPGELIWGKASIIYWSEPVHGGEARWDRIGKRIK